MKYWKDETEPVKAFVTLWETLSKEQEFIDGMKKVNQLIWFDYTEDGPNCSFHVDGRDGKFIVKAGKPDRGAGSHDEPHRRQRPSVLGKQAQPRDGHHPGADQGQGLRHGTAEARPQAEKGGFVLRADPQGFWLGRQAGENSLASQARLQHDPLFRRLALLHRQGSAIAGSPEDATGGFSTGWFSDRSPNFQEKMYEREHGQGHQCRT